ncbi:MAG: hypothetical protein DCC49_11860 [Acidobacteria bacterium]|nr:MAG: hypothetical protein DCC49_11860 [Acidobacteriota bacterium]
MDDSVLQITTHGEVGDADKEYALEKIERLMPRSSAKVLQARLKLQQEPNPALDRPSVAEMSVDVNGRVVRAHVAARQMSEAIDLLEDRLRRQLTNLNERFETQKKRGATHGPGEWRHGDLPARRAERFARPADEREVVRRKTFAVEPITIDEAAFDMEMLDHDFYLFTDADSGQDSMICRLAGGGYEFHSVKPSGEPVQPNAVEIVVDDAEPPRLDEDSAVERLNETDEPFLFYVDSSTGRGNVAYLRYDGHYGLITPSE